VNATDCGYWRARWARESDERAIRRGGERRGPPAFRARDLQAASALLRPYGVNVACAHETGGRDSVLVRTQPCGGVEYRHVLGEAGASGAIGRRIETTYVEGSLRAVLYDHDPARPVVEVTATPAGGVSIAVLDPSVFPRVAVGGTAYHLAGDAPCAALEDSSS
jgi:hypothetical protein